MPREIRKRGKKKKGNAQEEVDYPNQKPDPVAFEEEANNEPDEPVAGPSWMRTAPGHSGASGNTDSEAPFGYVEADVKAYFRTVDLKLREWQEGNDEDDVPEGIDPNEERRAFVTAALNEMSGKELQLATDPDCSTILERLARSMDDFSRRVFMDKLAGSYVILAKHRFASHVCQTFLTLAHSAISHRNQTMNPVDEEGLRTMISLVSDAAEELLDSLGSLIMDPFASHVIRALILTLSPDISAGNDSEIRSSARSASGPSKKSAAFKAKQGSMKSVFGDGSGSSKANKINQSRSPELMELAAKFVRKLRGDLDDNSIRALASDKVANPVLQIMIRIEAECNESEAGGSLMDRVLMGLITQLEKGSSQPTREDYIETLLRDPTASHLVETLLLHAPRRTFNAIWKVYFEGRLAKLASHPVSNYVVTKGVERIEGGEKLAEVVNEMKSAFGRTIKLGRTGVHRALLERAAATSTCEAEVVEGLADGFGFKEGEERTLFVPCVLNLQTLDEYQSTDGQRTQLEAASSSTGENSRWPGKQKQKAAPAYNTQGAVLLQAMLKLHEPYNQIVIDSVLVQPIETLLAIACDPVGSRVLDVVLESDPTLNTTIPLKARRKLILAFLEHFPTLVDDKLGSRVADRCWAASDPYLKERIARSLIPHERFLAQSFYGKFFARNLHLTLLQRNPEQWKAMQAEAKAKSQVGTALSSTSTPVQLSAANSTSPTKSNDAMDVDDPPSNEAKTRHHKKEKKRSADAIDDIFDASGKGKKRKREHQLPDSSDTTPIAPREAKDEILPAKSELASDKGMKEILGAIKDVPKGQALKEGSRHKKKGKN